MGGSRFTDSRIFAFCKAIYWILVMGKNKLEVEEQELNVIESIEISLPPSRAEFR